MSYRSNTRHTTECVEAGEAYACEGECALAGRGAPERNVQLDAALEPTETADLKPGTRRTEPSGEVLEWGGRGWRVVTAAELRRESHDRQRYGGR